MNDHLPDYSKILVNAYNKQRLVDPQYSIRRFAKDINIHPAVLSLAMKGKRLLAPNDVEAAMKYLEMSFEESMLFVKSTFLKGTPVEVP